MINKQKSKEIQSIYENPPKKKRMFNIFTEQKNSRCKQKATNRNNATAYHLETGQRRLEEIRQKKSNSPYVNGRLREGQAFLFVEIIPIVLVFRNLVEIAMKIKQGVWMRCFI